MDKLDAGNVAYSVGPGNHDMGDGSLYETYFGISRFAGKSWYGGFYGGNNYNNYSLFSASGMDFILINLQYYPSEEMLAWADALLKTNPNRRAIVESHDILNIDDSWSYQKIYTALKDNPNLFLMVCGHMHTFTDGAAYRAELGDDGHTIHIMLADYQLFSFTGNGYLRILRFSPSNDKIYATTYSPYAGKYITSYPDQMEMNYEMTDGKEGILVETRAFLEGPYDATNNEMTILLNSGGFIPTTSPYSEDARTISSVPTGVTDWVLVQLRSNYNGSAVASKSAFLNKDGRIVADDGITGQIEMTVLPGSYYVVVKHRNHLGIMSSTARPCSYSSSDLYDFTTGQNKTFTNGPLPMADLGGGKFGMFAGDANSDGTINATDYNSLWLIQNGTPFNYNTKFGDFNLDATINAVDYNNYLLLNNGKATQAQ